MSSRKTSNILIPKILSHRISQKEKDVKVKVALVGPGGCGKSALAVRMLSRRYIWDYCPVLEDTYYRIINNGGLQISLEVMDTSEAQGETFHDDGTVSSSVGAKRDPARWTDWADIVLLVFSVTNRSSLAACRSFLHQCQASEAVSQPTIIAVGNKNDLQRLRSVNLSEASVELGTGVADIVETSAAEDQDSVDMLLATALKEHFHSAAGLFSKSAEEISLLMISNQTISHVGTPTPGRKDLRTHKRSYWSKMAFLPRSSL